jgi:soluble epoxide hydrolase / lipid-phosphate phosphatase
MYRDELTSEVTSNNRLGIAATFSNILPTLLPQMDNSLYKELKVDRGFNYRYYFSPAAGGMPVLLFLHGIPSTSHDWVRQVEYFRPKGYGIVAPDMLGFGRTSRPLDVNAFRQNLRAKDIIDILNKENIDKVVGIGHDWYV